MRSSPALRVGRNAAEGVVSGWRSDGRARLDDRYALDPFAHLDDGHVYVLDLETLEEVPLDPWPNQRELLESWFDLEHLRATGILRCRNVHEEKSRQMGTTWILAYGLLWAVSYHPLPGLVVSLRVDEVADSKWSTDSIFGRIRFMARHPAWPDESRPGEFLAFSGGGSHAPMVSNVLRAQSYLAGAGAVSDPGRGGRYGYALVDEAARLAAGEQAHAAIARAVPTGRLYNSTPHGRDNLYFRLRETRPANFTFLRHHWSAHPVYAAGLHVAGEQAADCVRCAGTAAGVRWTPDDLDRAHRYPGKLTSPWYDLAVVELTDEQVASELDIDYSASLSARVYPGFSRDLHVVPTIPYDPALGLEFAWDYGYDTTAVVVLQETATTLDVLALLEVHEDVPENVSGALRDLLADLDVPLFLLGPEWTSQMVAVGDPAGEARSPSTGRSLVADYASQGWSIVSERRSIDATIRAVNRLLFGRPKRLRISAGRAGRLAEHFEANRWPTDRQGRRKIGATEPLNDAHNHALRALAYYAAWKYPPPDVEDVLEHATTGGRSPEVERILSLLGGARGPGASGSGSVRRGMRF